MGQRIVLAANTTSLGLAIGGPSPDDLLGLIEALGVEPRELRSRGRPGSLIQTDKTLGRPCSRHGFLVREKTTMAGELVCGGRDNAFATSGKSTFRLIYTQTKATKSRQSRSSSASLGRYIFPQEG
jgi:hypothetical protein